MTEQVKSTPDEQQHSNTSTLTTAVNQTHTTNLKSTSKIKRVKQSDDLPAKKVKLKDRVDVESERFSIATISGELLHPTSKTKQKKKSLSGVISVSKPKVRRARKDTDISKLNNGLTFGTGQATQWF